MYFDLSYLSNILKNCRTIAVVGLSPKWHRPSYFAAKYMQEHGYRIIPVNPSCADETILGEKCYAQLLDIPDSVDLVDVFRRSEEVYPLVEQAISMRAKGFWQQLGVNHLLAFERAKEAGLWSVADRCVKIEHARIFGGLHWMGVNTGILSAKKIF
ncbi:MAG: CoA-binding protein [Gammaproteobacteria bacterium]|nr:CoA-binding protein [Gammaproteobacteria bacterium]